MLPGMVLRSCYVRLHICGFRVHTRRFHSGHVWRTRTHAQVAVQHPLTYRAISALAARLLELLLHAELVRVAALLLAAIGRTRREARVAPGMRVDQNWSKYNGGQFHGFSSHNRINASSDAKAGRLHLQNTLCSLSSARGNAAYMRQIFLSVRYLRASTRSDGSMIPPRRRSTR
jgi:hypothetical protein